MSAGNPDQKVYVYAVFSSLNSCFCEMSSKKPLTSVSKRVPGVHRKRGVGEGLAEKVGKGLAKGWHRVGEGLADFLAPSNFGIPEVPV